MPKNKRYHPNYRALYPGVEIPPEVLAALHKSDRKMEYMEWDLKHTRIRKNKDGEIVSVTPPREASLECIEESGFSVGATPSLEEIFFRDSEAETQELHRCLALLTDEERALIRALYVDKLTEREYAAKIGRKQQSVNERKLRILCKLKNNFNDFSI